MSELKIRCFDDIEEEEVRWLWKPYIAFGKITVIQGDPGNGKTTLALALAAIISRRDKMPTGDGEPFIGNVLYQSGEDNPYDTIKPRLIACGADCAKIAFIEADESLSFDMLEEAIMGTNAKFVVLDPLQSFLGERQDIASAKTIRPIFTKLGNIAAKTGAALVIIGHMNKSDKGKAIYRGLGSIDITAAARSVLLIGKQKTDDNRRFMTQIKNNLTAFGKPIEFSITENGGVNFIGECDITDNELLNTAPKPSKYLQTRDLVMSLLEKGDVRSNEIFDACLNIGVSMATIQTVKKKLGIKSINKDNDWYWSLKKDDNIVAESEDSVEYIVYDDVSADIAECSEDEIGVNFTDDILPEISAVSEAVAVDDAYENSATVRMSPYGEIRLIDWRLTNER